MNIFCLDPDPGEAARCHCDTHVNSQIRESCQMLSTAFRMMEGRPGKVVFQRKSKKRGEYTSIEERPILPQFGEYDGMGSSEAKLYWDCYHNHPCNKWIRERRANYCYLRDLLRALRNQFIRRNNLDHGSIEKCRRILFNTPSRNKWKDRTDKVSTPALAMPEIYREPGQPVSSYRRYYIYEKHHLYWDNPIWTGYQKGVQPPVWLMDSVAKFGKKYEKCTN